MELNNKIINIFLTGGGYKGAFQSGFLFKLGEWLETHQKYQIGKVYGSSIGAINGSIFLNNRQHLRDFWNSIKSYKSMMSFWCNIPIIGRLISIIYGFFKKCGLINPIKFYNLIRLYCSHNNNKLVVCATNLTQNKIDFIDSSNHNNKIVDYIIASSSLWMFSPPIKINNNMYADGGILKYLPINEGIMESVMDDINVVVSCAKKLDFNDISYENTNLLFYLDKIIHMMCDLTYENDLDKIIKLKNFKCYIINQKLLENISMITFEQTNIRSFWDDGIIKAEEFIRELELAE